MPLPGKICWKALKATGFLLIKYNVIKSAKGKGKPTGNQDAENSLSLSLSLSLCPLLWPNEPVFGGNQVQTELSSP